MSSEQNGPDVPVYGGAPPIQQTSSSEAGSFNGGAEVSHGVGQSKSSRRRRRKRKNKGVDGAPGVQAASGEGQGVISSVQASAEPSVTRESSSPAAPAAQGFQAGAGQHQNRDGGAGGKRWKKKFRDRERPPRREENPGNTQSASGFRDFRDSGSNGGGSNGVGGSGSGASNGAAVVRDTGTHQFGNRADGFKRRGLSGGSGGKQSRDRGPRGGFVGPMDHSYRAVSGNFGEVSPSTIDTGTGFSRRGGYHAGDAQPIDYSQGRVVPVAEDAPTKIFFFIEDLFFLAKIQETARKLGVKVAFIKNDKESLAQLTGGEEADRPGLIVVDLNNANAKPLTLIPKLKAKLKRSTSIVGFLSHLQGDLKAKAVEAGCDTVMPRSAFSQNLPNLLRRYGIEEEEEANFNQ